MDNIKSKYLIITDAEYLARFDDTDVYLLPPADRDETTSLCGVASDSIGRKKLTRYADLSHDGNYHIFQRARDRPPFFANRDWIFHRDGPTEDGFCGVWTWSVIPNGKDPSRDYVNESWHNERLDAIEVFIISEALNLDNLLELLKSGIEYKPHSRKVMFAFYASKGQYVGILCSSKDLNTIDGKTSLAEDYTEAPVYQFTDSDFLRLDTGLSFYRKAFAGIPIAVCQLKSHIEIVKSIVLRKISWPAYKAKGITRAKFSSFKDCLSAVPVDDITAEIAVACHCAGSKAQELLDEFLKKAGEDLDGNSLEDEIIRLAISANAELQERVKALIHADWEAENKDKLNEAQKELNSLEAQLKSAAASLTEVQEAVNKTKLEEERLSKVIAEKEKLADDVERAVAERIKKACENAADFIADMAFVSTQPIQVGVAGTPAAPVIAPYHVFSASEDMNNLEVHHSWGNVVDTVEFELYEAGAAEKFSKGLAAFLCAAYIKKQPIFLVGPNAVDIAQAFCAAVTGHKHGILCCEGSYNDQAIAEIGAQSETIIIINNLLESGWINRLPEILSRKDIFYIATHPYAEDIQAEPKSLYGFMLPLFTEFFVNKKAAGDYHGGCFAADFADDSTPKDRRAELKILSRLPLSSLVRNQINNLAATAHSISPKVSVDDDFVFAILPIAYASLTMNELTNALADPQNGMALTKDLKRDLHYILGDI